MTPTQFEDRLLAELCQVVAERPRSDPMTLPRARRAPRLLLGGAATAAVAAAVVLMVAGSNDVTPAFAVQRQPDGNVTVTINRLSDAASLERQLRSNGIPAVVNYTPAGKGCREPRGHPATASTSSTVSSVSGSIVTGHSASTRFTISRNMVGPGQTLVIVTSGGEGPSTVEMEVVQGPASPCVLVGAPTGQPAPTSTADTGGAVRGTSSGPETRGLHQGATVTAPTR